MRFGLTATLVAGLGLSAVAAQAATPPRYEVTAAVANGYGYDLNNRGDFVGQILTHDGYRGFVQDADGFHDVGTFGGGFSAAYGINNLGQATGLSYDAEGVGHAFLYDGGTMTNAGQNPQGYGTVGFAINDAGYIAGALVIDDTSYAFTYPGGAGELQLPGGFTAMSFGINNHNDVVGFATSCAGADCLEFAHFVGSPQPEFGASLMVQQGRQYGDPGPYDVYGTVYGGLWDINDAGWTAGWVDQFTLDPITQAILSIEHIAMLYDGSVHLLGGNLSLHGLNEAGQAVGRDLGLVQGFLYDQGQTWLLSDLLGPDSGYDVTDARDINDSGQIVATGWREGTRYALLLSPVTDAVPEPGAWALMLLGFGLAGAALRGRRPTRAAG